ncbi:MAG TPA: hypothetical protein VH373_04050 [Jatrophihabitantaceae bacterium]
MTRPVSVRGGAGGVDAHYDDMTNAARLFGRAAGDTGEAALVLHGYLVHPAVVAAAPLDPAGAAEFTGRLLAALDGPTGVTVLAARCTGVDVGLRAAAAAYLGVDRLHERLQPLLGAVAHAPRAIADGGGALARGDPGDAVQRLLTDDPELADLGVDLISAGSVAGGTWLLQQAFADGSPRLADLGSDSIADVAGPPRNLRDLMAGLAHRDEGQAGEIDVRLLECPDGRRRAIVDVPGTKDWSIAAHNGNVTSLATNLRAIDGEPTSYERGIVQALHRARVRADDDVLLVGHSEGGLVAVDAARHLAAGGEFRVSHVVVAGAPVGLLAGRIPAGVDVLALENECDVVPHLDGAVNPDRVNVTTVTTRRDHGDVGANHDLDASYVPGAADVDASNDPSVRAYLAGLSGFLSAERVQTRTFVITRSYP